MLVDERFCKDYPQCYEQNLWVAVDGAWNRRFHHWQHPQQV